MVLSWRFFVGDKNNHNYFSVYVNSVYSSTVFRRGTTVVQTVVHTKLQNYYCSADTTIALTSWNESENDICRLSHDSPVKSHTLYQEKSAGKLTETGGFIRFTQRHVGGRASSFLGWRITTGSCA